MKLIKSLFVMLTYALVVESSSAQTCQPPGEFVGGGGGYQYIANQAPKDTTCWTLTGDVQLVSTQGCGYSVRSAKAFDMHYGARVSQEFTVPSDRPETQWGFSYLLTMQDPNDDEWWNRLKVTVYDVTARRTLVSETYWGDDPDVVCKRRDLTFTGNLANHTLRVTFSDGSSDYVSVFRIQNISLIQEYD